MNNTRQPYRLAGLSDIAGRYQYLLCDAWGVLHNGNRPHASAVDALTRFRRAGGSVLVITNAARPKAAVLTQFEQYGVDHACFDDVVTSGDAARRMIADRPGMRIHHVGPSRDLPVYADLDVVPTTEEEADLILCTGLFDDRVETPDDYAERLARWAKRGLPMLCANPDKVVERGDRLVWCAGAIAERYVALDGQVTFVGKPHAPIYATAAAGFAAIAGCPVDPSAILAIGDGAETDVLGAVRAGLDVLFITGGIHADDIGPRERPDGKAVAAFLSDRGLAACGFLPRLVW